MDDTKILVTGAAGFIGYHLCCRLLDEGFNVVGVDNINDYYSVALKQSRLKMLQDYETFEFYRIDISDNPDVVELFCDHRISMVINLAAQAGVRYSLENPYEYVNSNVKGFLNIIEAVKNNGIKTLIYASSSSVYGSRNCGAFAEDDRVDKPASLYAATKKTNELIAYTYSSLYDLNTIGLRFFTVYGEWGRPDMAYYSFTEKILQGKPITLFNYGKMKRDFTYIDDIVDGIYGVVNKNLGEEFLLKSLSKPSYEIFNIGNNQPVELIEFVKILEQVIGRKAKINYLPMQDGDVPNTYADISKLNEYSGFYPNTSLALGIKKFVRWYKHYYKLSVELSEYTLTH